MLNRIFVEALAGVYESQPEIECNLEFRIPLIKRNIVYDIVCDIAYDMKPRTYDLLVKTYDVAYDEQRTMSYKQTTTVRYIRYRT